MPADPNSRGLSVREVAARYRVGRDTVRAWIRSGLLPAINTGAALCGRPRFVVLADGLAAFERLRSAAEPPRPARRKRRSQLVDYYPDGESG